MRTAIVFVAAAALAGGLQGQAQYNATQMWDSSTEFTSRGSNGGQANSFVSQGFQYGFIANLKTLTRAQYVVQDQNQATVEPWMLGVGGIGIVIGLATWGYRVMETVGKKITELTPSRGFAAELGAATTIVIASRLGIPVSTTHVLVGSVLGVGFARGIGVLDMRVVGRILVSWVATLPIAATLSVFFFYFFKGLLTP